MCLPCKAKGLHTILRGLARTPLGQLCFGLPGPSIQQCHQLNVKHHILIHERCWLICNVYRHPLLKYLLWPFRNCYSLERLTANYATHGTPSTQQCCCRVLTVSRFWAVFYYYPLLFYHRCVGVVLISFMPIKRKYIIAMFLHSSLILNEEYSIFLLRSKRSSDSKTIIAKTTHDKVYSLFFSVVLHLLIKIRYLLHASLTKKEKEKHARRRLKKKNLSSSHSSSSLIFFLKINQIHRKIIIPKKNFKNRNQNHIVFLARLEKNTKLPNPLIYNSKIFYKQRSIINIY